jgi:hypothetical protein
MCFKYHFIFFYITTLCSLPLYALDNPHFYRATNIFLEPRIEHDLLSTIDASLAHGSTNKGRNESGSLVSLLDIYGIHSMQTLGTAIPNEDTNPYTTILKNLAALAIDNNFATFSIDGTFATKESNLFYIQNFTKGLFVLFHLPIRNLQIKNISFIDLSSHSQLAPNKNTPEWQSFLTFFNPLLESFDISIKPFDATGVGDFTSLLGWTHNYQNTSVLDFIDGTLTTGILAPTGKKKNPDEIFSLPLGYNGHWGIPISVKLSLGMYEWITLGISLDTIFFMANKQIVRVKTAPEQSSFIILPKTYVSVKKGTIWDAGIFLKADHFIYGLSLTAAYSCAGEQKTTLTPLYASIFDKKIINSDQKLKNWYMHTLHFVAEYDFAKQDSKAGLRVGFFYNHQFGGIRIFDTNMTGGSFGIDIGWDI